MKIAVIGAGVTGLTVARRLADRGEEVCLFDAGPAGGLAAGFKFPGQPEVYLEKFYHHIFRSDRHIIRLIEESGLGDHLLWRASRSGVFAQGRIWPLESPVDLLRCRPIGNMAERLKMGLSMRYFQKTTVWKPLDAITCEEFFRRRHNLRGYQGLWEPLLKAKFGTSYANIPAAFLWGRIHPRSRSRDRGKESLGYLRGGFQRLMLAMVRDLKSRGVTTRFGGRIVRIDRHRAGAFTLEGVGESPTYDRIVWTGNPADLAGLLTPEEPDLLQQCQRIRYVGACCLVLLLDQPLSDYYWINNLDPEITFGGVIEHTNLVYPADYGGLHVVYVINYLDPDHPQLALDVDQVFRLHLPSLRMLSPAFRDSAVRGKYLFKTTRASPLYDREFLPRVPPFVGWSQGIGLLGMPQVYPIDRNMNHCVDVAHQANLDQLLS